MGYYFQALFGSTRKAVSREMVQSSGPGYQQKKLVGEGGVVTFFATENLWLKMVFDFQVSQIAIRQHNQKPLE
jgi:hypothetical protein